MAARGGVKGKVVGAVLLVARVLALEPRGRWLLVPALLTTTFSYHYAHGGSFCSKRPPPKERAPEGWANRFHRTRKAQLRSERPSHECTKKGKQSKLTASAKLDATLQASKYYLGHANGDVGDCWAQAERRSR